MNIEEMIADAIAEEEVNKTKEKDKPPVMVAIPLEKYERLILKATDYSRIIAAIAEGFKPDGAFYGTQVADTFKALYPDVYENIIANKEG